MSMAIIAMATPFVYSQIATTNHDIADMSVARAVTALRSPVLNFVRQNQDSWPDEAQIKMDDAELAKITPDAVAGFIDKRQITGSTVTDVYLAFPGAADDIRTARIAHHIGGDAAVVGMDGIAYGATWAVAAPDFRPGYLIYRITRDVDGEDRSKYLHRGTSGEDSLNMMMRDLNMGGYAVLDVGTAVAESVKVGTASANFIDATEINADNLYFSDGANISGTNVTIKSLRVTGDITGFRNIYAGALNGDGFGTVGRVIADRATIEHSVNVSRNLELKSDTIRTVSGFTAIHANSVATSYISAEEMVFYEKFGLTVSGELLMSTTQPIKIGGWTFPSNNPPQFSELTFARVSQTVPAAPVKDEFGPLMMDGWKSVMPNGGEQ